MAARRTLPRFGIDVPAIGLGGAALGGMHGRVTEEEASEALDAAWTGGMRYFDTAPLYGFGLGELRTGAALRSYPRDDFVLSTKVGWRADPLAQRSSSPEARRLPAGFDFDYSFDGTLRSVEDSLLRLGLDRIDMAFVHDIDPYNHQDHYRARLAEVFAGALPALARLRSEGVIRAIGIGVNDCDVCMEILREADLDCLLLAGRYSLLDLTAASVLLPECERRGVGVIIGAPFNTGILARSAGGKYNHVETAPADVVAQVKAMRDICEAHRVSLLTVALQFPLRHAAVNSVLPGPRSREQVLAIMEAARTLVPEALWREIEVVQSMASAVNSAGSPWQTS